MMLPAGFARDPTGAVTKDPDREVRESIELVFSSFLQVRSAAAVMRLMVRRGLALPRHDHFHDVCWRRPTVSSVTTILKNPAYAGAFVYGRTGPGVVWLIVAVAAAIGLVRLVRQASPQIAQG